MILVEEDNIHRLVQSFEMPQLSVTSTSLGEMKQNIFASSDVVKRIKVSSYENIDTRKISKPTRRDKNLSANMMDQKYTRITKRNSRNSTPDYKRE